MTKPTSAAPRPVPVHETPIELCQFLKFAGLAESGGAAKKAISDGKVLLNGTLETRKRKKLAIGDVVTLGSQSLIVAAGGAEGGT